MERIWRVGIFSAKICLLLLPVCSCAAVPAVGNLFQSFFKCNQMHKFILMYPNNSQWLTHVLQSRSCNLRLSTYPWREHRAQDRLILIDRFQVQSTGDKYLRRVWKIHEHNKHAIRLYDWKIQLFTLHMSNTFFKYTYQEQHIWPTKNAKTHCEQNCIYIYMYIHLRLTCLRGYLPLLRPDCLWFWSCNNTK